MEFTTFLKQTLIPMGLEWRYFHRKSIERRVIARIQELRIASIREYAAILTRCGDEKKLLRSLMSVTISRFFRDRELFQALREQILPELTSRYTSTDKKLQVWCAGCAGGEEPYSLAILWRSYFHTAHVELKILATDINPKCLRRAYTALYGSSSLKEVPKKLIETYFESSGQKYRLLPEIRKMVGFKVHDLLIDDIPGAFSLVFCRNTAFTYFLPSMRPIIVLKIHEALEPGGFLVIGRKERLPHESKDYFEPQGKYIYRRKS